MRKGYTFAEIEEMDRKGLLPIPKMARAVKFGKQVRPDAMQTVLEKAATPVQRSIEQHSLDTRIRRGEFDTRKKDGKALPASIRKILSGYYKK